MVRWEGGRFLVLFKGEGCRVSPRFHLFVLMLIKGTNSLDGFKTFCMTPGMERLSLHLPQAFTNKVYALKAGCGCLCNL